MVVDLESSIKTMPSCSATALPGGAAGMKTVDAVLHLVLGQAEITTSQVGRFHVFAVMHAGQTRTDKTIAGHEYTGRR